VISRSLARWAPIAILVSGVIALAGCAPSVAGQQVPDVRSHPFVVIEMLRMAAVGPRDVVFDLGSGDGRIVVAAAHEFGARAVGVEIDPALVAESHDRVRRYGVGERVTIIQGDLFTADLHEATVVMLYLSPDLNRRLRPKLIDELPPGARIVSQRFDMGDWPPTSRRQVLADGRSSAPRPSRPPPAMPSRSRASPAAWPGAAWRWRSRTCRRARPRGPPTGARRSCMPSTRAARGRRRGPSPSRGVRPSW
jgi:hypothetical protein